MATNEERLCVNKCKRWFEGPVLCIAQIPDSHIRELKVNTTQHKEYMKMKPPNNQRGKWERILVSAIGRL